MGFKDGGSLTACYATGNVTGGDRARVGGLLGSAEEGSRISACYAAGNVTGGTGATVAGLVGGISGGTVSDSYFDSETATLTAGGIPSNSKLGIGGDNTSASLAKTTAQLQYPTAYDGLDAVGGTVIYSAWNVDIDRMTTTTAADIVWDFGANNRYPKLKVDFDGSTPATVAEFGVQRFYFTNSSDVEVFSLFVEGTASGTIGYAKALMGTPSFTLADNMNFAISTTGEITVKSTADLDAYNNDKNAFDLPISATVGSLITELKFNVQVIDITPPEFTPPPSASGFEFNVADNADLDHEVGTIVARDTEGDALTYALAGDNNTDFIIGGDGVVKLSDPARLDQPSRPSYMLSVSVADAAGNSVTAEVNITVTNATSPAFTASSFEFNVGDNVVAGAVVDMIVATDTGGDVLTYTLTGPNNTDFSIDAMSGSITVSASLSFSRISTYMLTVTATDLANNSMTADVTITVTDATPPVFTFPPAASSFSFDVAANTVANTVLGTIVAADPGGGALSYTLRGDNHTDFSRDGDGVFKVSSPSSLDRSSKPTYALMVTATDAAGNEATAAVNITVTAPDTEDPEFTFPRDATSFDFNVADNAVANAEVGRIVATDNGGSALRYTTVTGHAAFSMGEDGVVKVSDPASLVRSSTPNMLTVTATDVADNHATATVNITVTGPDNTPPTFTASSFEFKVADNADLDDVVGTIIAMDTGGGALTYALTGPNNTDFSIGGDGVVRVRASLDRSTKPSYMLMVRVADAAGNSATATVNITVTAPDTEAPVFTFPPDASLFSFEVAENAAANAVVDTISATDTGGGTLRYTLAGDNNTDFSIDGDGVVKVSDPVSLDRSSKPSYMLMVTATDVAGNKATATLNITVTEAGTDAMALTFGLADEKGRELAVYPNPASDRVYVSGLESRQRYIYEVYSLLGQKVSAGQLSEDYRVDLEGLSAGVYLLVLRSESGEEILRSRCLISK